MCDVVIQSSQKSTEVSDSRVDSPPVPSETWEYGDFPVFEESAVCAPAQGKVKISPLKIINVTVEGKPARALKDSGAQIPLISQELASEFKLESMGEITVQGIFGHPVVAPLSSVGIQHTDEPGTTNITSELPVVCAVVEMNANEYDVILPSTVLKELQQVPAVSVNVVGVPLTHSSDVESVVKCDCNCLFTAV